MATYFSDRVVEYPNRYTLTDSAGTATQYTIARDEGDVIADGTALTADNLETGIKAVVAAALLNGEITLDGIIKAGTVTAKTKGNLKETVATNVSFGTSFNSTPVVLACAKSTVPHQVDVSVSNVTKTGCTLYIYRSSGNANTSISWVALAV